VVTNLATLADTRMFLEVDWVNGVPVNSEDRTDFYWNSGPAPTPMPTSVRPQQTKVIPTATAIRKSLGTHPQAPTPNSSSKPTQQPVAQTPAIGGEQSGGKKTLALIAGAIFTLLAVTLVALVWRRKAKRGVAQPTTPFYKAGADSLNLAPLLGMAPPAQSSSSLALGPSRSDLSDRQTSPSLPVPKSNTDSNLSIGLASAAQRYRTGEMPELPTTNEVPGSEIPAGTPDIFTATATAPQARRGQFIQPGKIPSDAP
jgi:hypothetical protein